ncbi:hypothetical protein [Maribellus sediminis]|uniref:hypothetical protein n=1 Tax=Maribellus sediminis TaxID=2696285 RepID=UPI001431C86B|nr:hypothetical protein [Maribellus sediminis]
MRRRKLVLAIAALAVVLAACQKNDFNSDKDQSSELGVQLKALNSSFALPVNTTKSGAIAMDSITWDSAQMIVSTIKFEAELKSLSTGRDSIEVEYKWHGPQLVNLLDTNLTLGNFVLTPAIYDEIELKVSGDKEDAGDDPVFYLSGTYKSSTGSWPIAVEVWDDLSFKTEREDVEVTDEGIDITSEIHIYLDELMLNVEPEDLDNAQLSDGVILISREVNRSIYETIFGNLKRDCHAEYKYWGHKKKKDHHEHGDDDED